MPDSSESASAFASASALAPASASASALDRHSYPRLELTAACMPAALAALRDMCSFALRFGAAFRHMRVEGARGLLLHGAAGSGKSAAVRAVARECGARLLVFDGTNATVVQSAAAAAAAASEMASVSTSDRSAKPTGSSASAANQETALKCEDGDGGDEDADDSAPFAGQIEERLRRVFVSARRAAAANTSDAPVILFLDDLVRDNTICLQCQHC